jgi:CRISPR system Cascade subunit CasD
MGVRIDREGILRNDFQTAQNVAVVSGDTLQDQISNRHYLSDAAFLVGFEGDRNLLVRLHLALAKPVWPLFLGRKSYIPSLPPYLPDGLQEETDLRTALLRYPLLFNPKKQENIRMILESHTVTHESRIDTPVSFALGRREFRERFVQTEFVPANTFQVKEDDYVPFTTHP